jgi:hypothetical protein
MNWIKKNPAQFALALVSAAVLGLAFMLYSNYSSFAGGFSGSQGTASLSNKAPELTTEEIDVTLKAIPMPSKWEAPIEPAPSGKPVRLFASDIYVVKEGRLSRPEGGMFFPPVPNAFFEKHGLSYLDASCLTDDPDKDGFDNTLEFFGTDGISHVTDREPVLPVNGPNGQPLADDSTSPIDPKSNPPYHTRLRLGQVVQIPFNLRFMAIDIDRRNPKNVNAQINAGGRTMFVEVPGKIPNTKYETKSYKKIDGPAQDGIPSDISELTVTNTETKKDLALVLGRDTNSPESYAVIRYLWVASGGQPTADMNLKKGMTFKIPPESEKIYTLDGIGPDPAIGLAEKEVLIKLPDGGKLKLKVEPK